VASSYPGGLDSFTTKNNGDTIDSSHIDALQDAVVAIETALGVNVGNRLAAIPTYTFSGTAAVSTDDGPKWFNRTGKTITLTGWDISSTTAPAGADVIADVLKNGTTTFTTTGNRPKLTAAGSQTHATSGAPDTATIADGDYLQVKLVQVGSSTPGSNVTLTPIYA
jgi:hypothetical protein